MNIPAQNKASILLLCILILPYALYSQSFEKGIFYFQKEQYDSAIQQFNTVEKKTPFIEYKIGEAFYNNKNYDKALPYLTTATSKGISNASFVLFETHMCLNDTNKAYETLKTHLVSKNKITKASLINNEHYKSLPKQHRIEIDKYYTQEDILEQQIEYLLKIGNSEKAYLILQESDLNKSGHRYLVLLSKIMYKQGNLKSAIHTVKKTNINNRNYQDEYYFATLLFEAEDYGEALDSYSKTLSYSPDSVFLKIEMAKCYHRMGKIALTEEILENYCSIFADDFNAKMALADCYYDKKEYSKSLLLVNEVLNQKKGNNNYFLFRATIYYTLQLYKEAEKDICMSLDLMPQDKDAYYLRSLCRIAQNNVTGACYDMQKASELGSKEAKLNINTICK